MRQYGINDAAVWSATVNTKMIICLILPISVLIGSQSIASPYEFECIINAIYELQDGHLKARNGTKGIGGKVYVDRETGIARGYFGTDGDKVMLIRRPKGDGILTIEIAYGVIGDSANLLRIERPSETKPEQRNFFYKKNWLHITGTCS